MTQPDEPDAGSEKPTEIISPSRRPAAPPLADEEATRVVARGQGGEPAVPPARAADAGATVVLDQANAPTVSLQQPASPTESAATEILARPTPVVGEAATGVSLPEGEAPRVAAATSISLPQDAPVVQMAAARTGASASPSAARTAGRSAAERNELPDVGETIKGRFELVEELGRGGMGAVFRARDLRKVEALDPDPWVAIKFISGALLGFDRAFVALQREAKNAQTLNHPNIVKVFDFDRDHGMVFLTMEVVTGVPLHRRLRELDSKPLSEAERKRIAHGMLAGMAYAHSRGISHADLKPSNMMLDEEGQLKILDFGIARRTEYDNVFDADDLFALTIDYASAEMLARQRPIPSDDVYALGCILYALHTGTHPFGHVRADQAQAGRMRPAKPASTTRVQWAAMRKALAFERKNRFVDAAEFLRAYEGLDWRRIGSIAAAVVVALGIAGWFAADPLQSWATVSRLQPEQRASLERSLGDGGEYLAGGYAEDAVYAFAEALTLDAHNSRARAGVTRAFESLRKAMPREQFLGYLDMQANEERNPAWLQQLAIAERTRLASSSE